VFEINRVRKAQHDTIERTAALTDRLDNLGKLLTTKVPILAQISCSIERRLVQTVLGQDALLSLRDLIALQDDLTPEEQHQLATVEQRLASWGLSVNDFGCIKALRDPPYVDGGFYVSIDTSIWDSWDLRRLEMGVKSSKHLEPALKKTILNLLEAAHSLRTG